MSRLVMNQRINEVSDLNHDTRQGDGAMVYTAFPIYQFTNLALGQTRDLMRCGSPLYGHELHFRTVCHAFDARAHLTNVPVKI